MLKKYDVPAFAELSHIKVDIHQLVRFYEQHKHEFTDVIKSNQGLCGIHHELVRDVYDNFEQISLTSLPPDLLADGQKAMQQECNEIEAMVNGAQFSSRANRYRQRKLLATQDTILNEHKYDFATDKLKDSYVEHLTKQFRGRVTRVRLVRLKANSTVPPHIDYDPSYAVRVIIPIIADDFCINMFWSRGQQISTTLSPGKVYFLNTGLKHAVVNFSKSDRVTLMMSVQGQEDIQSLRSYENR